MNNHAAESDEICEPKQADEDNALEDGPNNLAGSHSSLSSKSSSKSSSSSAAEEVSFENLPEVSFLMYDLSYCSNLEEFVDHKKLQCKQCH